MNEVLYFKLANLYFLKLGKIVSDLRTAIDDLGSIYSILDKFINLYEHAQKYEYDEDRLKLWNLNIASLNQSIEAYYEIWDLENLGVQYGLPIEACFEELSQIQKFESRTSLVLKNISPWTSVSKITKFIFYFEYKFIEVIYKIYKVYPSDFLEIKNLLKESNLRLDNLKKITSSQDIQLDQLNNLPDNIFV